MGAGREILFLEADDVERFLDPASCIAAVEAAFRARGEGQSAPTGVLGVHAPEGGFHVKAAALPDWRYFVAKVNANFPLNPDRHGLPTIQGVVALFDGRRGVPLAILDSVRITALRTAAASAVAANYLALPRARSLVVVGCGTQGRAHLAAMRAVRSIEHILLHDAIPERAERLAVMARAGGASVEVVRDLGAAVRGSEIIVTCTPSHQPFLGPEDVSPGAFVAAVGADNEHKLEIEPALMGKARVVVDLLEQCALMGDLRGAIAAGAMRPEGVHAELAEVVAGRRPGRTRDDEIFVFDSTGVALEDIAAAVLVYERARARGASRRVRGLSHLLPFLR